METLTMTEEDSDIELFESDDQELGLIEADTERFSNAATALESLYQASLPLYWQANESDVRTLSAVACEVTSTNGFSVGPSFALETIDDTNVDSAATRMVKKIKEYALKIWTVLVDAYEQVADWLIGFFQKVTNQAGSMKAKAQELLKKIESGSGPDAPAKTLIRGRVASMLGVTEGDTVTAMKNLSVFIRGIEKATAPRNFNELFAAIDKLQKGQPGDEELKGFVNDIQKAYNPIFPYVSDAKVPKSTSVEVGVSEPLPGNMYGYMAIPNDPAGLGDVRFNISDHEYGPYKADLGIPALSRRDASQVLAYVIDICDAYEDLSKVEKEILEVKTRIKKMKDLIQRSVDTEDKKIEQSETDAEKFKSAFRVITLRGLLTFIPRATAGIHQKTMSFSLSRCKSALYWVEQSHA